MVLSQACKKKIRELEDKIEDQEGEIFDLMDELEDCRQRKGGYS
jgi:hypothetical protein